MTKITNEELIDKASSVINSKKNGEYIIGNVGSALITDKDSIYLGVCIDVGSSMGFCAEHNAMGAMITAGEYKIKKIVAVWKDDKNNTYILSPCGRCREFMRQIDNENLEADVILEKNKTVKLKDLLPYYDWCHKI
jgi:cytidine deaminase